MLLKAAFLPFLITLVHNQTQDDVAHVLHQALLEVTGVVYYILNDYTNLRQIRLKLQPTG